MSYWHAFAAIAALFAYLAVLVIWAHHRHDRGR